MPNNNKTLSTKSEEYKMEQRGKCSNVNVRGKKPSNANVKACIARMKASGGTRSTRRSTRRSNRRTTRRS
jgi:hypothetical protein